MPKRCGCGDTCACVIQPGDGATVDGSGTPDHPYVIGVEGTTTADKLIFDDSATIDFTTTGPGTSTAPMRVSADAKVALTELTDVEQGTPSSGDVPVWQADHWEFQAPPVAPAGAVNVSHGIGGTGQVATPLKALTSADWPLGQLSPWGAAAGFPASAGDAIYIDEAGNLRSQPTVLWRDSPNVNDSPDVYPFGVSVLTISSAQATAGGWYSTGIVVTQRRYSDSPGVCSQTFYANTTVSYNPRVLYRFGNGANTPTWQPWRGVYQTGHVIPASTDLNTYLIPGQYIQPSNANAAGGTNYPAPYAGMLEVGAEDKANGMVWQRYTTYSQAGASVAGNATYQRGSYNGTWGPWLQVGGDTGWIDIAIQAGFSAQGTEKPQLRMLNGVVYTRGGWSSTGLTVSSTLDPVGTIPAGYRPTQNVIWRAGTSGGAALAEIFISAPGNVSVRMGATSTYVMLGVSYLTT